MTFKFTPSDPPQVGQAKMCAWNTKSTTLDPNPLEYGKGFKWTSAFNCTQLCDDPHWKYFWNIYAWDPDAQGGAGDWVCIHDFDFSTGGQLGNHGGHYELQPQAAQDWWDDNVDPDDYDLSKGLKFTCKVKCMVCKNSAETGAIVMITGYPDDE